jgi:hypothetical protein
MFLGTIISRNFPLNLWAVASLIYNEFWIIVIVFNQFQKIMKALMMTRADSIPANED